MKNVKITVIRRTVYDDLIEKYENPMQNACDVEIGEVYISIGGEKPDGFCERAWTSIEPFARELANGGGYFFGDWMKNPHSAMVSCNDGFRPVTFLVEAVEE